MKTENLPSAVRRAANLSGKSKCKSKALSVSCSWIVMSEFCVAMIAVGPALSSRCLADPVPLTDLGLGGGYSSAYAINASGQAVGIAQTASGSYHAALWDPSGAMIDLGTLGGNYCVASLINDSGQVAGRSEVLDEDGGIHSHAFFWDIARGMEDIDTDFHGVVGSGVSAINAAGKVVGGYTYYNAIGSPETHAFVWDRINRRQDLGTLGGSFSEAKAINDAGQVVGYSYADTSYHAFIWDQQHGMIDLIPGGSFSIAYGINASGQVVGTEDGRGVFLWDASHGIRYLGFSGNSPKINAAGEVVASFTFWDPVSGVVDLGSLGGGNSINSDCTAINALGQVVGYSLTGFAEYVPFDEGGGGNYFLYDSHAFVWDFVNGMQDLGTFGGADSMAFAINDNSQIIGIATLPGGHMGDGTGHAFLSRIPFHAALPTVPSIASMSPNSASASGGPLNVIIDGANLSPGSVVLWDNVELTPSSTTEDQLQVSVPAGLLNGAADVQVISVRVRNSSGETSNPSPFTIVRDNSLVAFVQSAIVTGSAPVSISTAAPGQQSGLSATYTHAGAEPASVSAVVYNADPTSAGAGFQVAGSFLDLNVHGAAPGDTMDAYFYYSPDAEASDVILKFYDQATGQWLDVSPVFNDVAQSRFSVHFDANSVPKITELTGTFFAPALTDHLPPTLACANISIPASVDPLVTVVYPAPSSLSDNVDAPSQIAVRYSIPSGSGFKAGSTLVTCTATDRSGNIATTTFLVTRQPLAFTGFLSPLGGADASGGTSTSPLRTCKMGSTIPLKFTASCNSSAVITGAHKLQAIKYSNSTVAGTAIDLTAQDAATSGTQFRLLNGAWQFNLDTKGSGMSIGVWRLEATLSDGSVHSCWIQLK